MPRPETPCLSIAIARLKTPEANRFATWILQAPHQRGYVHHDRPLPENLSDIWQAWLEMFSLQVLPNLTPSLASGAEPKLTPDLPESSSGPNLSYTARLMQNLGINLWQWLFDGPVEVSLNQSQGIAIGQDRPLRIKLDLREPDLIALPWEIMQPEAGSPAISLSGELLFSRTTSDVNPLSDRTPAQSLKVLLVLGENPSREKKRSPVSPAPKQQRLQLQLEREAAHLAEVLEGCGRTDTNLENPNLTVPCRVETLIQPTPAELIAKIETKTYNVLFYAGHGEPGPDGGWLFLGPETTLNGTELAQVLVRGGVSLAVFNACWGAVPAMSVGESGGREYIPRSSLAEVLIHHGVPAVLGMRDAISDREALSFITAFAKSLSEGVVIDRAVAVARQNLLTLYKFNQPAWTLPVLYMHPEFDGQLVEVVEDVVTQLPTNSPTRLGHSLSRAYLRLAGSNNEAWPLWAGILRVGRWPENDVVVQERWVSQKHGEIFSRNSMPEMGSEPTYFLRDFSRYGTLISDTTGWQRIHREEVALRSGTLLKFGSSQGQTFEFIIETISSFGK